MKAGIFEVTWKTMLAMLVVAFVVAIFMIATGHAQQQKDSYYADVVQQPTLIGCDAESKPTVIGLPPAVGSERVYVIKKLDSSDHPCCITTNDGDTFKECMDRPNKFVLPMVFDSINFKDSKPRIWRQVFPPDFKLLTVERSWDVGPHYEGLVISWHYKDGKAPGAEFPKPLKSESSCKDVAKKLHVPCRYYFFHFVDKGRIASDGSIYLENGTTRHELIRAAMRSLIRDRDEWQERARKAESQLRDYSEGHITKMYGIRTKTVKSGTVYRSVTPCVQPDGRGGFTSPLNEKGVYDGNHDYDCLKKKGAETPMRGK